MYAVIVDHDGALWWYGAYEDREFAENLAKQINGSKVVLYHPFDKGNPEDNYGREEP